MIWKLAASGRSVNKKLYWHLSEGSKEKSGNPGILVEIQNHKNMNKSLQHYYFSNQFGDS
jgi:hypothetical protein